EFAARLAAAAEKARREGRAALEREMRRFLPPSAAAACLREAAGMARDAASLLESAAAEIARLFGEGGGP
ncbi:MAG: hypothetical protein H5T97_02830, partial [Firmicutes bacterium]|nr:hypothetical protein [Bacillota bacterium]